MKEYLPTVFVIFGATGDLMARKIAPALFKLHINNNLPKNVQFIGFARRNWNDQDFQEHLFKQLSSLPVSRGKKRKLNEFLALFSYHQGNFNDLKEYPKIAEKLGRIDDYWKICSNKLFYLAVPPEFYSRIFNNLSKSGLTIPCGPDEGWTRILVEKPFGKDLRTAEKLDEMLGKLFKEEQIYRIDHYLAKDMLQSILHFRFSNNLFESGWNDWLIESIHIKVYEKLGVEKRGTFYDGIGALRDVGQNHLLQMLALVTMDNPLSMDAEAVRLQRAEILSKLRVPTKEFIRKNTYRAQYEGYQNIDGIKKGSVTETFFKLKCYLDSSRFNDIPIILESGKRMKDQVKEIVITFKHSDPCLCPPGKHYKNKIVISLEPEESIVIHFWTKKPGLKQSMVERKFSFYHREVKERIQYVEEYEKLLLDCILGNQLLFVSTEEVKATWKFIDSIIDSWDKNTVPLDTYAPDSQDAEQRSSYITSSLTSSIRHKNIGIVGMGKMGSNIARRLKSKNWNVVIYNRSADVRERMTEEGFATAPNLEQFVLQLEHPRIIFLMVKAGMPVNEVLFSDNGLVNYLDKGDVVIDGGNSYFKDAIERSKKLKKRGIHFVDVGVSGGPSGALRGACLMVGGEKKLYEQLKPLYKDLSGNAGLEFFEGAGAGHFIKMVHNGIEYGIMQSIAEGFNVIKHAQYNLSLAKAAALYNKGSVIESRLVAWLEESFQVYGEDLRNVSGSVAHSGEGEWTVKTAHELGLKTKIIENSLQFRVDSQKNPDYTGQILTALRNRFGGHEIDLKSGRLNKETDK